MRLTAPSNSAPPHALPAIRTGDRDPLGWTWLLTIAFGALASWHIGIPSHPMFDEIHYLPPARDLLTLTRLGNPEHPPFGKEIIALSMWLGGDNPTAWRIPSMIAGCVSLFAFCRALWWTSRSRFVTIAGGILLATNFMLYIQSRIAMLDGFMHAFAMVGVWQLAVIWRAERSSRWRLALAGISFGLALGAKWSIIPLAILPGAALALSRLYTERLGFLTGNSRKPLKGISLIEAAFWLGVLPLMAYSLTFLPGYFVVHDPISPTGLPRHHLWMYQLQESVVKPHPYQSHWWQWAGNIRPIWYLYEVTDGAQRGVLLLGNPLTMLLGLPAVLWCAIVGLWRRSYTHLVWVTLYLASMALWVVAPKPVQFYYHYFTPATFLMACLAVALNDLRCRAWGRWVSTLTVLAGVGMFAWFFPIISSAKLPAKNSFETYTWLRSWR